MTGRPSERLTAHARAASLRAPSPKLSAVRAFHHGKIISTGALLIFHVGYETCILILVINAGLFVVAVGSPLAYTKAPS